MAKFEQQAELPISEQAQIRREKLEALRAEKAEKEKASVGTGDNGADEN